jgi:hypothetical protein
MLPSNYTDMEGNATVLLASYMSSSGVNQSGTYGETFILTKTLYVLFMFVLPVILGVGFIGNLLSFMVFTMTPLKVLSSSVYLAALALADNGFILAYTVTWLPFVNVRIFHQPGWCQTFIYLTYVFSFLSVWYVCAFTIERFIVVFYPLKRYTHCTVRRAQIIVVVCALLSAILYTFTLFTNHSIQINGRAECQPMVFQYGAFLTTVGYLDSVLTLFIPFVVIATMNSRIACLMVSRRGVPQRSYPELGDSRHLPSSHDPQTKITNMLVVVSTTFIVLNVPSHSIRLFIFCMKVLGKEDTITDTLHLYQHIFQTLFYVNYAINGFLYAAVGQNFRHHAFLLLKRLLTCSSETPLYNFRRRSQYSMTTVIKVPSVEPSA